MAKIVKKVVKDPRELAAERKRWTSMERVLNAGLRRIDPRYEIRNLTRHADGTIEFETSVKFAARHRKRIDELFSLLDADESDFVQMKFYLPRSVQHRIKQRALDLDVPASSLVAAILAEEMDAA